MAFPIAEYLAKPEASRLRLISEEGDTIFVIGKFSVTGSPQIVGGRGGD
jgi:hypothetical protein